MTHAWHKLYQTTDSKYWTGRHDAEANEYYFQIVHCLDLTRKLPPITEKKNIALFGFACDAGIKRNLGRPGAAQGPFALRQALAKLAFHNSIKQNLCLYDVGNIVCENDDLEIAQTSLADVITLLSQQQCLPIVLGGGHETAWGHYQGIAQTSHASRLGIINFDAHFDLRPLKENKGNSGTPFLQIAHARNLAKLAFDYFCIGIQPFANSTNLFQTAEQLDTQIISAEDLSQHSPSHFLPKLNAFIEQHDAIYLTFCLDVFATAIAPGVSAPQALGVYPQQVLPLFKHIVASNKVCSFDVVELSPPLDHDNMTAKLGAALIAEFVNGLVP